MPIPEKLRWRIVHLVDKVPGQCWSRLADWAGRWFDPHTDSRLLPYGLPWEPQDSMCRGDAARVGSCYCGKLRQDPGVIPPPPLAK